MTVCHGVLFMDTSNYPLALTANLETTVISPLSSLFLFLSIKVSTLACLSPKVINLAVLLVSGSHQADPPTPPPPPMFPVYSEEVTDSRRSAILQGFFLITCSGSVPLLFPALLEQDRQAHTHTLTQTGIKLSICKDRPTRMHSRSHFTCRR